MKNRWQCTAGAGGLALIFLVSLAPPIGAHEKGVLHLATRHLVSGDSVGMRGEHFGRHAVLRIQLVGTAGRTPLGEVRTDSAGAFQATFSVPPSLNQGSYRVVAVASDGDEVASVDVSVVRKTTSQLTEHRFQESTPSSRPLVLARARSQVVTGAALLLIVLSVIGSAMLLKRPRAAA